MFTATTSTLAAAGVLAAGAFIGAAAPGPADPHQGAGVSQQHRHDGCSGHPGTARMHERMTAAHPGMARMHERMMGGMGGMMMEGDSGMGLQ